MELAISTCYDYSIPIEQSIEYISKAGFKFVSLGGRQDHSQYHKEWGRSRIVAAAEKFGVKIDSIHAPFDPTDDLTQLEEVLRHSAVIEMKRCITACKELKVGIAILHLNSFNTSNISERLKKVRESLTELLDFAHDNGLRLAAENLPGDNSLIILKYALELFEDDYLGLCFDSGHAALNGDTMELLEKFPGRLLAIHLHDNDGKKDLHQLPFEGVCDLPNLAAQLNKRKTICPITIESEVAHSAYKAPEPFLSQALEAGNRFREMLKT